MAGVETTELESLNQSHYPAETVLDALATVALNAGNTERAAKQLEERGITIPARTLRDWKTRFYPNRYRQACEQHAPQIEAAVLHRQREIAHAAADIALQALEVEHERLNTGQVKDAASTAYKASLVSGIAIDKTLVLTGRPTQVTEHRTFDQALKKLGTIIEGTAEDADTDAASPSVTNNKPRELPASTTD